MFKVFKPKSLLFSPGFSLGRFIVFVGILIIFFSAAVYFLLGKQASDTLVEEMFRREELATRAGTKSVDVFFNLFGRSLAGLATREDLVPPSGDINKFLTDYTKRWSDSPVAGVVWVDTTGKVKYNGSRSGSPDIGRDVSDRDYFIWAKSAKAGDIFVSKPVESRLGSSKGRQIVVVATPLINPDGSFAGLLGASIVLQELTEQYLAPLKVTNETRIYLIGSDATILSAPYQKLQGRNYLDYVEKSGVVGKEAIISILKGALASTQGGRLDIALPDESNNGVLTRFLISYSRVNISNTYWILGIATPANEALTALAPFYLKNVGVMVVAFFGFMLVAVRLAKLTAYNEAIKKEHELHHLGSTEKEEI